LLTIVSGIILVINLSQARQDFQTVARDSFISIESVANIRQLAADANADESRLLLSPDAAGLKISNPAILSEQVLRAYRSDVLEENFYKKQALIKTQLVSAWNNITYPGEFEQLCKIQQNPQTSGARCNAVSFPLDEYLKLDRTIRDDFKAGKVGQAIKTNTGQSNDTFDQWDSALLKLSAINESYFNKTACASLGNLKFGKTCQEQGYTNSYLPLFQLWGWILFPFIGLLTLGSFWLTRQEF
jgi:hypothetical protein